MKKLNIYLFGAFITPAIMAYGQNEDTTLHNKVTMEEITISATRTSASIRNTPQQVQVIYADDIEHLQAQNTADVAGSTGNVFIQKSQQGGGSTTMRGFEANRVVLMVDGVRMNNLIYRAGHLQNIVTMDNTILDRVELLYGPSSTMYGSDALGGVIHFYTRRPEFATMDDTMNLKVNAFTRYSAVNTGITGHFNLNIGLDKFASLTAFTYSSFGDVMGGRNQNPFYTGSYGERPYYVERINGVDSLVKNNNRYLQVQSGYTQYDFLQRFAFKQGEHITHGLNIQYSNSGNVPRYDRLTDPGSSGLAFAEWYYGPQTRMMAAYDMNVQNYNSMFEEIHLGINYQAIGESRHSRKFGSNGLSHRIENVNVIGANLDLVKRGDKHTLRTGIDFQYNTLVSTANKEDITTGLSTPLDTRYPDGDNSMLNAGLYVSHDWQVCENTMITDGIRVGYSMLHSSFIDTSFFPFPYNTADQNTPVYSGSIGVINSPAEDVKISLNFSSGFRVPNIDDQSKLFSSVPGALLVPNPDLKPERTFNTELGFVRVFREKARWENYLYYTELYDAMVVDAYTYNGEDSVWYDGVYSQVLANQNKDRAYVYGFSSAFNAQAGDHFYVTWGMNYTYGRIKTDSTDVPLDHIPPFMTRMGVTYKSGNFRADFTVMYNGSKRLVDYHLNGEDNEQYATSAGMPAWMCANIHFSYKCCKYLTLQAGVDNIFDTQYRTFASGINAPGRNMFAAIRFHY